MNALLIYPHSADTYFGFNHALKFISKRAILPPLGLTTISPFFPDKWKKRLIDLNVTKLNDEDLHWANIVFVSGVLIQRESMLKVIKKCKKYELKIVGGGPIFNYGIDDYAEIDHFILKEAEEIFPEFIRDLENGIAKRVYENKTTVDITKSPPPDFHLIDIKKYATLGIQISRGCPYFCEFCEIPSLFGNISRVKEPEQIIKELDIIYKLNWKGSVFIVDDHFLGNKKKVKGEILPAIAKWMEEHNFPFTFYVQCSINVSDDDELLDLMVKAGINMVFLGIESPSEEVLKSVRKTQNRNRNLLNSIKKIQKRGLHTAGGFILGFDDDSEAVFSQMKNLIQDSGIVWAMISLLNAPLNTPLYNRLSKENRLIDNITGNNTDYSTNIVTKMDFNILKKAYENIIKEMYSIKPYYKRINTFLNNFQPSKLHRSQIDSYYILAFVRIIFTFGIIKKGRIEFWKLIFKTMLFKRRHIFHVVMYIMSGYHFRKVYGLE